MPTNGRQKLNYDSHKPLYQSGVLTPRAMPTPVGDAARTATSSLRNATRTTNAPSNLRQYECRVNASSPPSPLQYRKTFQFFAVLQRRSQLLAATTPRWLGLRANASKY
ncbi:hypothetical protein [Nostoc mirabile]|uniref:hypothetical protein n=1 Tax=Nostoc mirabile TaxID=2907820 RepID=UPI003FD6DFB6